MGIKKNELFKNLKFGDRFTKATYFYQKVGDNMGQKYYPPEEPISGNMVFYFRDNDVVFPEKPNGNDK